MPNWFKSSGYLRILNLLWGLFLKLLNLCLLNIYYDIKRLLDIETRFWRINPFEYVTRDIPQIDLIVTQGHLIRTITILSARVFKLIVLLPGQ